MKRIKQNNPFGYRVGYRENGSRLFHDHFLTFTYQEAVELRHYYLSYPPIHAHGDHVLINPSWEIRPINLEQVLAGIWQQNPF